jgi:hypothetical protein
MCRVWLRRRLPPRLSRCRCVSPEEGGDRGGAIDAGEAGLGLDPVDVADLADDPACAQVADPDQLRQSAAELLHRLGDAAFELADLFVEPVQRLDAPAGELRLHARLPLQQPSCLLESWPRVERGQAVLVAGAERDEVGVQPVGGPDALAQELLAVVAEQLQIARRRVGPDRRQPLLAGGHACDRERVPGVALAAAAHPLPLTIGQRAAHVDDRLAFAEQEASDAAPDPAGALHPEAPRARSLLDHPGVQRPVCAWLVRELPCRQLTAELVDETDRQRVLVRVDPDRDQDEPPSRRGVRFAVERCASTRRAVQAPIKRRRSTR